MKTSERRQAILQFLERNHIGNTAELSEELDVSAMTIHRDFAALAKQGVVTPIRGGAVLNRGTAVLYGLNLRQTKMPLEKRRIGQYCAEMVREGTTVFIDCGSTAERIAEAVRNKANVTVMTNSLDVAHVLSGGKGTTLIMAPGVFSESLRGFSGQMTTDFMRRFQVDILFLGANGIDAERGLTSPDYTDAETKRALIAQAHKVVVAADHTKLGQYYFETIAKLSALNLIVTDNDADEKTIAAMRERDANIVLV